MLRLIKRRVLASSLALMLISAAVANAAQPAVLQQVPDDAAVVFVVKNLKQLATKLSNAGTRMKLPVPEDLLATAMGKLGLADGLDQNGSMALAILDVGKDLKGSTSPAYVVIVPTTDSKAMLKSLDSQAADAAGIMKVTLPDEVDPGYAVVAGKYLIISSQSDSVTRFLAHTGSLDKKISPESAAAFDANDLVIYANLPVFGPKAADAIDSARDLTSMQMATSTMDKTTAALADVFINSMFDFTKESLTDSTAALVTFRLNDDGATFGAQAQFKPDSPIGKFVAAQKGAPVADLTGLPDGKILLAGASAWDKSSMRAVYDTLAARILANPDIKENPQLGDIKKMLDVERDVVGGLSGEKIALYAPVDPANGWINAVIIADIDDPKKALDAAMLASKLNVGTDTQGIKVEQKFEENAKTINGISLTKVTATYTLKDDAPQQARAGLEMVKQIYGPDGMVMYYGIIGKQLVAVMGNDGQLLESAITAAQAKDTALSKNPEISAAAKAVLPNSISVAYLPASRWVNLALKQMGLAPAEAPADKAPPTPITISAAISGSNVTTEMVLPMNTVIDLSATIQRNLGGLMPH